MRTTISSLIFLSLVACGCAGVKRPDAYFYGVNGTGGYLKGYNLRTDYNDDGVRKSGAQAKIIRIDSLKQLNGYTCTDPTGLERTKVFISDLKSAYERNCKK